MKAMKWQWGNSINGKFLQAVKDSKMGDSDDTPSAADFTKFCKGIKTSLRKEDVILEKTLQHVLRGI
jgi:hypothetical protein